MASKNIRKLEELLVRLLINALVFLVSKNRKEIRSYSYEVKP